MADLFAGNEKEAAMIHPPRSGRRVARHRTRTRAGFGASRGLLAGLLVASVLVTGAGSARADDLPAILHALFGSATDAPPQGTPVTLLVAGDIAHCTVDEDGDRVPQDAPEATAKLIEAIPAAAVQTLGDNAYDSGSADDYAYCYHPTWGAFKGRTRPAPGNHDYVTGGAKGYFDYFNGDGVQTGQAGDRSEGYYSYDLGAWHVVVLNSECDHVPGGCGEGSPQEQWLRDELAAHPGCQIVATHHPRWSSDDEHGNHVEPLAAEKMQPFWQAAADAGVELYLAGHAHDYERFAPMDGNGNASPTGVREIVVGTGGADFYTIDPKDIHEHSEVHNDKLNYSTHGVLELTLYADRYEWRFLPVVEEDATAGQSFTDDGEDTCH
jgi:hypothetical protein